MQPPRSWFGLLGGAALACLGVPAAAQPVGSEFQVNTYTTNDQSDPEVASDAEGNFIVVWQSYRQDGSGWGIFGQRYDSGGVPQGGEFRVNSHTTITQYIPDVASDASGNFMVIWTSCCQDGSNFGIFGQRYDNAGQALGTEFRVNSYTTGSQGQQGGSVASDAEGNFVVVWQSHGQGQAIFGQRYDNAGQPLGGEFQVNSYSSGSQANPSVGSDASGNFVVVWRSLDQDGSSWGIFGQRYDNAGEPLGGEFQVNSYTTGPQEDAAIALDASGNFVVTWGSFQDGSLNGVFGKRYDRDGVPQSGEFRVNSYTTGDQRFPSVASDADGNFVIVWQSYRQDGSSYGVFGQRYDSGGVPQGGEFRVNSYTTLGQLMSSVASGPSGNFVVAWKSRFQDGSFWGVFGQRYDFSADTITVVRPNTNVRWLIGSVKEIAWAHNLGLNSTFRIELDRNDDGIFEELIAPDAPADSATSGSFAWTVTSPPTSRARVRVSWTDDLAVSDVSDTTFRIKLEG